MLMSPIPSIRLYSQRMLTVWWINKWLTEFVFRAHRTESSAASHDSQWMVLLSTVLWGRKKKILWLLMSKEKVTWHKYSRTENCQKGELCKLAIILLSPLRVQIPSWYRQIAGVESTEKTFYRHPTTVHGSIREVFFFFHLKCLSSQGSWRTSCPLHFPHLTYEENRVQRD